MIDFLETHFRLYYQTLMKSGVICLKLYVFHIYIVMDPDLGNAERNVLVEILSQKNVKSNYKTKYYI